MREGLDIMNIWLDSGLSWSCVLGQESQVTDVPKADLYIEGLDQFSGWFYTSLLTRLALTGEAPYKKIFVHGFTLDENGNKVQWISCSLHLSLLLFRCPSPWEMSSPPMTWW